MFVAPWIIRKNIASLDRVRTGSGPGSPRGQPAWGGGCDRIIDLTLPHHSILTLAAPLATSERRKAFQAVTGYRHLVPTGRKV